MYFPDRLKVGHMFYDVAVTDEVLLINHKQCKGIIDYEQGKIKLADDKVHGQCARYQTFWHEVFHAFTRERSLVFEDEELVVEELGKAMAAFCIDNNLKFKEDKSDAPTNNAM